jgi:hypothetical protein
VDLFRQPSELGQHGIENCQERLDERHDEGVGAGEFADTRSMMRIMARRTKAATLRAWRS